MELYLVDFGGGEPFGEASKKMARHHQIQVSKESVRRKTERAGEVYERLQADEDIQGQLSVASVCERVMLSLDAAKVKTTTGEWRDVKTLTIAEVEPQGETDQNSYFSRMCEYQVFAKQVQIEVQRRQVRQSSQACAVNDGADWIPPVIDACRPDALRILDFYHAAEHLAEPARAVFGEGTPDFSAWFETTRSQLRHETPDDMLTTLADLGVAHPDHIEAINKEQAYFTKRLNMLHYVEFKSAQWPIGSGSGEAAHKVVIQARMKRAGMRWHPNNINPMAALRNLICNDRWQSDWPLIVAAQMPRTAKPVAPPALRLPVGFQLRPATPWRDQPVGKARFRSSIPAEDYLVAPLRDRCGTEFSAGHKLAG